MARPPGELPFVDEQTVATTAPPAAVWASLLATVRTTTSLGHTFAKVLGCDPAESTGDLATVGDSVPGFRVAEAIPSKRLVLRGRHRFSDYELTFVIEDACVRAETHAAFPGVLGRMYRAAVIGSGSHRVITGRMLRQIARGASH